MKMLLMRFGPVGLFVLLVFAFNARADLYTQISDFDQTGNSVGGTPLGGTNHTNVRAVSGPASMGVAYSNQYTSNALPTVGDHVRVVAANQLSTVGFGDNTSNPFGVDVGPNQKLVAVFAGDAIIQPGNNAGEVVAQFSPTGANVGGKVGIFLTSTTSNLFSQSDPNSWVDFLGTGAVDGDSLVGLYTLKPQEGVHLGNMDAFDIERTPDQTNAFAVNTLTPAQLQGTVLFRDVLDPLFTNLTSDPAGSDFADEGLVAIVDEQAVGNLAPIGVDELNAIAEFLGQPTDVGGEAFATALGSANANQFDATALLANGDLTTTLDFTFVPAQQTAVPEPASIAVWIIVMGLVGGWYVARRRAKK